MNIGVLSLKMRSEVPFTGLYPLLIYINYLNLANEHRCTHPTAKVGRCVGVVEWDSLCFYCVRLYRMLCPRSDVKVGL